MDLAVLIIQALVALLPQLITIWKDFSAGKVSVDEARAVADAAFSAMWASLIDPKKDAAATDAAVDEAVRKKFEGS